MFGDSIFFNKLQAYSFEVKHISYIKHLKLFVSTENVG